MLSMSDSHRSLLQVMNQVVDQYFYHSNLRNVQNASQPALPSLGCVHCYFIIQTLPLNAQKQVGFCVAQNIQPQDNTFAQILVLLLKSHTVVISNVIYKITFRWGITLYRNHSLFAYIWAICRCTNDKICKWCT